MLVNQVFRPPVAEALFWTARNSNDVREDFQASWLERADFQATAVEAIEVKSGKTSTGKQLLLYVRKPSTKRTEIKFFPPSK